MAEALHCSPQRFSALDASLVCLEAMGGKARLIAEFPHRRPVAISSLDCLGRKVRVAQADHATDARRAVHSSGNLPLLLHASPIVDKHGGPCMAMHATPFRSILVIGRPSEASVSAEMELVRAGVIPPSAVRRPNRKILTAGTIEESRKAPAARAHQSGGVFK
jgi:hypothetical protein